MIEVAKSLTVGQIDAPLDARTRIDVLADMELIQNPFLGMIVYCVATAEHYKVTALKSKQIGALTVPNAAIDTYTLSSASAAELSEHVADTVRHTTSEERAAALAGAATLASHTENSAVHITSAERTAWNAKANAADIPSDLSDLTDTSGLLDSGGGTDWNVSYTTTSITLIPGVAVKVSAATAARTLTFPSTITNGARFPIAVIDDTHLITLARNGHKINGVAENDSSLAAGDCITLAYDATADNLFLENEVTTGDTEDDPIGVIDGRINALRPTLTTGTGYFIGTSGKPTVQVASIVADGANAVATVTGTHAFLIGDSINLDNTVNFNGLFVLTAVDATSLTWSSAVTATENSLNYTYARYVQSIGYAEIQAIIDSAPRDVGGYSAVFRVHPGAYYLSETIRLERFHHGAVYLMGEDWTMNGAKFIVNNTNWNGAVMALDCNCPVYIMNLTVENTGDTEVDGAVCIRAGGLPYLEIGAVRVMLPNAPGTYENCGINGGPISFARLFGCSFFGGKYGIFFNSSLVNVENSPSDAGKNPQYGAYIGFGLVTGNAPVGQIANLVKVASTPL